MIPAKLSNETIGQIAKCLQMAILTGTDIVDHLRQLEFEVTDNVIDITPEFKKQFEENISKMITEIQEQQSTQNSLFL